MSPFVSTHNLAARMGRWSASHWKTAVFGWLAFVVAALMLGGMVAKKQIDKIEAAVADVGQRHPGFFVGEAGSASSGKALDKMFADQLTLAGERSIPITIIILLLVFGALIAVGVPLLLALSGVAATIGISALPSHLVPMDPNVSAVILLVGLAVGVDYSLFYLKREREERAAGRSGRAAIEAAAATSGRSVLISGFTVMIAMAGMMFSGDKSYLGFGIATMMVVGVAMLGSLTVLPALLSKLGNRVEKGKIPYLHRLRHEDGENRFWKKILKPAMRRPGIAAAVAGGALLLMAVPVLHLHTTQSGMDALPNSAPTVGTIKKIQNAFSNGDVAQTEVAIKADLDSTPTQHAIASLEHKVVAAGLNSGSIEVDANRA